MNRVRIKELVLVAAAGSLLVFEVIGLRGALPTAMRALGADGVVHAVRAASRGAAAATATALDGASASAAGVAVDAAKGAAHWLGTVTPPAQAAAETKTRPRASSRSCLVVVTLSDGRREVVGTCRSGHRAHAVRRSASTTRITML